MAHSSFWLLSWVWILARSTLSFQSSPLVGRGMTSFPAGRLGRRQMAIPRRDLFETTMLPRTFTCNVPSMTTTSLYSQEDDATVDLTGDEIKDTEVNGDLPRDVKLTFWQRVQKYTRPQDKLTFRQRLAKMGLNCVLSYGFVSNMSYCVSVSAAWYIFCRKTGTSPLAPGQWKGFLAVYAGFFVFNNIVRPIRLAVSVAVAPAFDNSVQGLQRRMKCNRATAIGLTVFLLNFCGTLALMSAGILGAATLAGVPLWAK